MDHTAEIRDLLLTLMMLLRRKKVLSDDDLEGLLNHVDGHTLTIDSKQLTDQLRIHFFPGRYPTLER